MRTTKHIIFLDQVEELCQLHLEKTTSLINCNPHIAKKIAEDNMEDTVIPRSHKESDRVLCAAVS